VLTVIDGAHAPGHIEVQLDALGADFYTGNCHKWLCAPKGSAFLHARQEHHQMLHATVTSWGYVAGTQSHSGFDA
jgi:isopenicillin-N epimerase